MPNRNIIKIRKKLDKLDNIFLNLIKQRLILVKETNLKINILKSIISKNEKEKDYR